MQLRSMVIYLNGIQVLLHRCLTVSQIFCILVRVQKKMYNKKSNTFFLWMYIVHFSFILVVFSDSGFHRTLCGGAWLSLTGNTGAFVESNTIARYGCCPSGSYMSSPNVNPFSIGLSCSSCPTGYESAVENDDTSCTSISLTNICTAGKYSDQTGVTSDAECKPCSAGRYSNQTGLTSDAECHNMSNSTCPIGVGFLSASAKNSITFEGSTVDDGVCTPCVSGKYKKNTTPTSCIFCPLGHHTANQTAAVSCSSCTPGFYADTIASSNCIACSKGKFNNQNTSTTETSCTTCEKGKYANSLATRSCLLCPAGFTLPDDGGSVLHDELSDCQGCGLLQFSPFEGHFEECYLCLTAKKIGSSSCDGCNPGLYKVTKEINGNKTDFCFACPSGYFSDAQNKRECQECPVGYFANTVEKNGNITFDRCQSCDRGKHGTVMKATNEAEGCSNCTIGRFSETNAVPTASGCKGCPRGKWSSNVGVKKESACINCGTGKYGHDSEGANIETSCQECDRGKYLGGVGAYGSGSCLDCPSGFVQNSTGRAFCLPCISGSFSRQRGNAECVLCAMGRASSTVARNIDCDVCTKGKYQPEPGTTACLSCIPGKYQTKLEQTTCIDCEINAYTDEPTQAACKSCSAGQYTVATNSASCQSCDAGSFGRGCKKCPSGWYRSAEDTDLTRCQQCAEGETTGKETGAASCTSCDLGTFGNAARECTACPANEYQDERKQLQCKPCLNGKLSNAIKTSCEKPDWKIPEDCSPNVQYLNDTADDNMLWSCLPCPNGAHCASFGTYRQIRARAGYWRVPWSPHNITFVQCLEETACLGASGNNNRSIVEGCAPNYNPPLCAACARGSYKDAASFQCLACFDNESESVWFLLLVVFATLAVIVGFTFATVQDGGEASAGGVVILKIAVNSGIISAGASGFPLAWPPAVIKMFQVYAVVSASAIGDSLSADCVLRASNSLRPVQAWGLTMVVIPPMVILLWVVLFGTMTLLSKQKTNYLKVHLPVSVIVTLLFAHPVVTKSAVKLVACRTVSGRDFLDADFNISCDSDEYVSWMIAIAIPMFVLFTFGVPLGYALTMYRHVRRGTLTARRDVYGFFFSGFRKEIWWFELWNTLRKSLFTICAVLFAPAGVMMQTWAALCLLLLFLAVFLLSQPYDDTYLNRLERSALSINVITLLLGLGLFTNSVAGDDAHSTGTTTATAVVSNMLKD